jgi:hypothetical protein
MVNIGNIIIYIVGALITFPIMVKIFDFFNIKYEYYAIYLLWFFVLLFFAILLPYRTGTLFSD